MTDYDPEVQFLANRGYAVLQVNHRGSTGFGIDFFNAGNNEWGRGMQQDLYDAVQWAIDQKIADPKRIAAMGASGGGFATLCSLEMRPDLFACGVDVVGPSDLAANFRSFPSYWSNVMTRWRRRGGDFDHDEELNRKVSPRYHVDKIRAPLLIAQGKNDARVAIATATQWSMPYGGQARCDLRRLSRRRPWIPSTGKSIRLLRARRRIPRQTSRWPRRTVEENPRDHGRITMKESSVVVAAVYDRRTYSLVADSSDGHRPPLQKSDLVAAASRSPFVKSSPQPIRMRSRSKPTTGARSTNEKFSQSSPISSRFQTWPATRQTFNATRKRSARCLKNAA